MVAPAFGPVVVEVVVVAAEQALELGVAAFAEEAVDSVDSEVVEVVEVSGEQGVAWEGGVGVEQVLMGYVASKEQTAIAVVGLALLVGTGVELFAGVEVEIEVGFLTEMARVGWLDPVVEIAALVVALVELVVKLAALDVKLGQLVVQLVPVAVYAATVSAFL